MCCSFWRINFLLYTNINFHSRNILINRLFSMHFIQFWFYQKRLFRHKFLIIIHYVTTISGIVLFLQVNQFSAETSQKVVHTVEDVAMGFIKVANEAMCRPIRALTQVHLKAQHFDKKHFTRFCFFVMLIL